MWLVDFSFWLDQYSIIIFTVLIWVIQQDVWTQTFAGDRAIIKQRTWIYFKERYGAHAIHPERIIIFVGQCIYIHNNDPNITDLQLVCIFGLIAAWVVNMWARFSLGKYDTYNIFILNNHELVSTGPYRWFRHPQWISELIVTGTSVYIFPTHYLAECLCLLRLLDIIYNIRVEERLMKEHVTNYYPWLAARY